VEIPLPLGDVLDRITILRIKARRITAPEKLKNIHAELRLLQGRWDAQAFPRLTEEPALAEVNERLWDVEDALRASGGPRGLWPGVCGLGALGVPAQR
jgi:hypothetical protein